MPKIIVKKTAKYTPINYWKQVHAGSVHDVSQEVVDVLAVCFERGDLELVVDAAPAAPETHTAPEAPAAAPEPESKPAEPVVEPPASDPATPPKKARKTKSQE